MIEIESVLKQQFGQIELVAVGSVIRLESTDTTPVAVMMRPQAKPSPSILRRMDLFEDPACRGTVVLSVT